MRAAWSSVVRRLGARGALTVTVLFAGAVTAVVVLRDVRATTADAQTALDSAAAMIGVVLGYLLLGRFWGSGRMRDLLLCGFLLLLGCSNAAFSAVPHALGKEGSSGAAAVAGVLAGAAFLAANWLPRARWRGQPRYGVWLLLVAVAVSLAVAGTVALAGDGVGSPDSFGATPDLPLTVAQLVAAGLFAIGALGSARHADEDPLFSWLAAAGLLSVGSRIDFAVSHSVDDEWYTAGTFLRLAFYAVLLLAASVEIRGYWRRVAALAVLEERRRLARDLHDGVAQELAFAATQARVLAETSDHPTRARLVAAAAERALDESRRAIAALTRPLDEPLEVTLAQCAEEVCGRFDTGLVLDVQPGVEAAPDTREALLRILREAVSNAARHSAASEVRVRLRQAEGLSLRVEDDGRGFDTADLGHLSGRFGLISMRERAEALGGTFAVVSRLQGGTSIEVTLP
ncbi:MAG: sensor histidine kinase [Frankiaceae bacterium]|nr:sensor histidine kinase [Frankiaceae bacterium]